MCLAEDFSDNEEMFAKEITKWSSNDLMDKIETIEVDEAQGRRCFFCWKLTDVRAEEVLPLYLRLFPQRRCIRSRVESTLA